jgi:hypothetical protein
MDASHRYAAAACVARGLLVHLAVNFPGEVWSSFRSWMRTMKTSDVPSEHVVSQALRMDLPDHLLRAPVTDLLRKTLVGNIEPDRAPHWLAIEELAA